jgi:hypothetical protein
VLLEEGVGGDINAVDAFALGLVLGRVLKLDDERDREAEEPALTRERGCFNASDMSV